MQFEDIGVFLSFISYPYYKDGKDLYKKVFKPFFKKHKDYFAKYDPDARSGTDPYPNIYTPAGYRMFSSKGLAILSLVDDYSFYNRFFNKNHIQSLLHLDNDKKKDPKEHNDIDLDFKSVVVSGITEREGKERSLLKAAKDTFLLPKNRRYRYIGIIRLKIDFRLLVGREHAMATVSNIKKHIKNLYDNRKNKTSRCDYIAIDCYDNDEMTIIAFADELLTLFNLLGNIRSIKNTDIKQPYFDETGKKREKHVFGLTYLCFGYDLERGLGDDIGRENRINCTIETKPGHRDVFYSYLQNDDKAKSLEISGLNVNISSGCTICFTMPLQKIEELERVCKNTRSVFRRDVRKVKVSLMDDFGSPEREVSVISFDNHVHTNDNKQDEIKRDDFSEIKKLLKEVGVSKMVRERLLALLEFYNLSCQNILQRFYLKELKPALSSYKNMIADMKMDPDDNLDSIEQVLNDEITNMENACYDRLHIQKNNQAPLEYSGGIQQYLTSFDFAYKQIYRTFSPNDRNAFYITISGAERASSERQLFKLNIHDIVYPELFITTVWKEIANFALIIQKENDADNKSNPSKKLLDTLNTWYGFTSNDDSFCIVRDRIHQSEKLLHDDEIIRCIKRIVSPELIKYYIKDYIVFHFAFCENYSLFWHFYFKTLLQTTISYNSLNHVDKRSLIHMFLRVFMVAKLACGEEKDSVLLSFLKDQFKVPYDSILSAQWMECYNKTLVATDEIYNVLKMFEFCKMIDYTISSYEENIYKKEHPQQLYNPEKTRIILKERKEIMDEMRQRLNEGCIIREDSAYENKDYTFLICLFGAFLQSVYELDYSVGNCVIKSLPRDNTGKINKVMEIIPGKKNDIYDNIIQILVDTTGGFFIPSYNTRKEYFRLRTTLYRSLWNYRFACEN